MGIKNSLYFLYGCVSGLVFASTTFFIVYYMIDLVQLSGQSNLEYAGSSTREIQRKKSTLIVVISSPTQLDDTYKSKINSWGQVTTDWKIAIGGISLNSSRLKKYGQQSSNHILAAESCEDFWPYSNITAQNLYCLFSAIHETGSTDYDWIVVLPDKAYLAFNNLNNILDKLDPSAAQYIGSPERICYSKKLSKTCLSYCSLQHALILSQTVFTEVVTQLSMCLCDTSLMAKTIPLELYGDILLGWCLKTNLLLKCSDTLEYQDENISALFLDYASRSWRHGNFVSLSSINSYRTMQEVHLHIVSLDLLAHIRKVNNYAMLAHNACQKIPDISMCNLTQINPTIELLTPLMQFTFPESHLSSLRKTHMNSLKWETVKGNIVYNSDRLEPSRTLSSDEIFILNNMVRKSLEHLGNYGIDLTLDCVPLAYFRHYSKHLMEYRIDLELSVSEEKKLLRSHLYSIPGMIDAEVFQTNTLLNVMVEFVVLVGNDIHLLTRFLTNYEQLCLVNEKNCSLNLIVYGKDIIYHVRQHLSTIINEYPKSKLKIIEGHGKFSPDRAIDLGMRAVSSGSVVFLCDVQIIVKQEFLQHCRMNAVGGKQFYYPDIFQFYNSKYVSRKISETVNRKSGYWTSQSNTFCLYERDYKTASKTSRLTTNWKDELAKSLVSNGLEMIRAPDPSLTHAYQDPTCHNKMSMDELSSCISLKENSLADRTELAEYIFYKEEKCSIRHWNLWDL